MIYLLNPVGVQFLLFTLPLINTLSDPFHVLKPRRVRERLGDGEYKVLVASLATRFGRSVPYIKRFIPRATVFTQYGKVQRLEGGDMMHAADIASRPRDGQDATYVRVRLHPYK
jgi:hypothetical protein